MAKDSFKNFMTGPMRRPIDPDAPPVVFDDVTVTYNSGTPREFHALDGVSFSMKPQEFVVFVGHSGSGKTTALNLIAGLGKPTSGTVKVLDDTPIRSRSKQGYMFARDALLPWRSAIRNVELSLEARGVPRDARRETSRKYLESVHIGQHADRYPNQLSQGQRQRVALARTWAAEPELMLMDEPFAALDVQTRQSLQTEFIRLWTLHKRSVVFVTHDLQEALTLADRIVVFSKGKVVDEFTIDLPRPRSFLEILEDKDALGIYKEVQAKLG